VVAGSDQNVQLLEGDGHPMFPGERLYVVQSIRFVKQALISSGIVDDESEMPASNRISMRLTKMVTSPKSVAFVKRTVFDMWS
jgi:hypothetical protein